MSNSEAAPARSRHADRADD